VGVQAAPTASAAAAAAARAHRGRRRRWCRPFAGPRGALWCRCRPRHRKRYYHQPLGGAPRGVVNRVLSTAPRTGSRSGGPHVRARARGRRRLRLHVARRRGERVGHLATRSPRRRHYSSYRGTTDRAGSGCVVRPPSTLQLAHRPRRVSIPRCGVSVWARRRRCQRRHRGPAGAAAVARPYNALSHRCCCCCCWCRRCPRQRWHRRPRHWYRCRCR
jgi:hypothetical protein